MWLVHNIIIMIDFIDLFPHNCSNTYADIVPLLKKINGYSYYTTTITLLVATTLILWSMDDVGSSAKLSVSGPNFLPVWCESAKMSEHKWSWHDSVVNTIECSCSMCITLLTCYHDGTHHKIATQHYHDYNGRTNNSNVAGPYWFYMYSGKHAYK